MTVHDLRDLLATLPQDAEVVFATASDTECPPLENHHLLYGWLDSHNQLVLDPAAEEDEDWAELDLDSELADTE